VTGGQPFSSVALYHLLRNATYLGKVRHKGDLHDGQHAAIVDETTWKCVQERLDGNGGGPISSRRGPARRWLDGRLFDHHGHPMRTRYAMRTVRSGSVRRSKRYWYYVSKPDQADDRRKVDRYPADPLERVLYETIVRYLTDHVWLTSALATAGVRPEAIADALEQAAKGATALSSASCMEEHLPYLHRVELRGGVVRLQFNLAPLLDDSGASEVLTPPIEVPITLQRNGRNRPIVLRADTGTPRRDPDLIALVADARRWMQDLIEGRVGSVAELTEREQLRPGVVSRILPLAWLAPDIAQAILEGRQPIDLTAKALRDLPELPLDWSVERRVFGFKVA
jgi:site-specific DNA recombinase